MRFGILLLLLLLTSCVPSNNLQTVNKTIVDVAPPPDPVQSTLEPDPKGAELFNKVCAGCHQPSGLGLPGNFPPLAGHVPVLLSAKGGREYLPQLIQNGLRGPIQVLGNRFNGQMPSFSWLEDAQLSSLLNYISTAWGNAKGLPADFKPYTSEEVKTLRNKLSSVQMLELRSKLGLAP